jgi:hypothetical protein
VSPVRYEIGSYITEDDILHSILISLKQLHGQYHVSHTRTAAGRWYRSVSGPSHSPKGREFDIS